jgi:uncharacterized protein
MRGPLSGSSPDVVHLTTNEAFARFFAAGAPGGGRGDLYEVEPDPRESLRPDPDLAGKPWGEGAFIARTARVVRIVARGIPEPPDTYSGGIWSIACVGLRTRLLAPPAPLAAIGGVVPQALKISAALPQPCVCCPWRVENDGKNLSDFNSKWQPPGDGLGSPDFSAERRRALWEHYGPNGQSLSGGVEMFCHETAPCDASAHVRDDVAQSGHVHWCAGSKALQHRAVLRAWKAVDLKLGPLKSWNAAKEIIADMLGVKPGDISSRSGDGWWLNGHRITFELVAAAAHQAIFDAAITFELVAAPSDEEIELWREARVKEASTSAMSLVHGQSHWRRVAGTGAELAAKTPGADADVVALFALFHDAMRKHDGDDPGHGARGAELAWSMRADLAITDEQLATLVEGCRDHTAGRTTDDPTVGVCWDADRLDLPRVGITPSPRLLSTQAARENLCRMTARRSIRGKVNTAATRTPTP